jgi:ligand-binding SRPBCC domain-containing protein
LRLQWLTISQIVRGRVTYIRLETEIGAPVDVCFDLCLNVDTQLSLDPGMCAVGGVTRGPLALGNTVTWRARHFGIPWHMTSRIIQLDRPQCFADEMQSGPFASWRHIHTFEEAGIGTRMLDDIEYYPPLGSIGRLFDAAVLERYLTRLLRLRNQQLKWFAEKR